jgi:glutathione S-transferase
MGRTLYRLEGCPFCELVVDRLDDLGLDYESVWVEGRHSNRDAVARVSGQRVVPVLVDEQYGVTMAESESILEFLDTAYSD